MFKRFLSFRKISYLRRLFATNNILEISKIDNYVNTAIFPLISSKSEENEHFEYNSVLSQLTKMLEIPEFGQITENSHLSVIELCNLAVNSLEKMRAEEILQLIMNLHKISEYMGFSMKITQIEKFLEFLNNKKLPCIFLII